MRPIKLKLENFLSHSRSEINFDKFNVALVLGTYDGEPDQSNGAGKSALFGGIEWALFGKSRHQRKDGVVKRDKREARVEFIFEVDGLEYKITRRRDKTAGESDLVLEQFDGTSWKNISCDTMTDTDAKITEIASVSHDIFVNSVYFKQNDVYGFSHMKPARRKELLKSLLKLEEWDDYQGVAKEKSRFLKAQLEEKNKNKLDMAQLKDNLVVLGSQIEDDQKNLFNLNEQHTILNQELINKTSTRNALVESSKIAPDQIKKVEKERLDTKKRLGQINSRLEENSTLIKAAERAIVDVQGRIPDLNTRIRAKIDIDLTKRNAQLVQGRTKRNEQKSKIDHLKHDLELGEVCPTCEKKITAADLKSLKEKQTQMRVEEEAKLSEIQTKLSALESKIKTETAILEDGAKAEAEKNKLELKRSKADLALQTAQNENKQLNLELKKIQGRDFDAELAALKVSNEDEINALEAKIFVLNTTLVDLRNKCDQLNMNLGSKNKSKAELEQQIIDQQNLQDEIKKTAEDFTIFDKLAQHFGSDGIQAVIIENVIGEIENFTNDILQKICNDQIAIAIKTQKQNNNGSWSETLDLEVSINGRTDEFEALSGGEQFRVSLAIRLAISRILSKRMGGALKFLLLDEVSSSLDTKGIKMFADAIRQLGSEMKILVITHDEKLKEQFEDIIVVNKTSEGSKPKIEGRKLLI